MIHKGYCRSCSGSLSSALSEHAVLCGDAALWLRSCELRSSGNKAGVELWDWGEGLGQAGLCGAAGHSPECRMEEPNLSRCLFGCPHTGADVHSRYLPGFAHTHTHSCVNLHMKRFGFFFSLHFLERNPPALHGLVWGQPTQTALSTHTCACVLTFELPCTCGCSPCSCPTPEHWQSPVAPTRQTGVSQRQTHPLALGEELLQPPLHTGALCQPTPRFRAAQSEGFCLCSLLGGIRE